MIPDYLLTDYITLFRGRGDVYGHDEGRCVKEPLTREVFQKHFADEPMGVYPMVPLNGDYYVAWGCSDFDTADAKENAIKLHDALRDAGIVSWIEKSRSKGFHVWVFATHPVLATEMRNMFLVAHQVADVPATEVNPKQTTLKHGQYGNYVRLPYAHISELYTDKQRIIHRERINDWGSPLTPMLLLDFIRNAMDNRTDPELIKRIADMYVAPSTAVTVVPSYEYDATLSEAMESLSPLGKVIWRDGPLAGKDRSTTLAKLGHECVRSGLNPSQTKTIVRTADSRWGKYHLRPNGELEIDKLVVRVHS
jgi:hypothetical protein